MARVTVPSPGFPNSVGSWALPLRHERITSWESPISKACWQIKLVCRSFVGASVSSLEIVNMGAFLFCKVLLISMPTFFYEYALTVAYMERLQHTQAKEDLGCMATNLNLVTLQLGLMPNKP